MVKISEQGSLSLIFLAATMFLAFIYSKSWVHGRALTSGRVRRPLSRMPPSLSSPSCLSCFFLLTESSRKHLSCVRTHSQRDSSWVQFSQQLLLLVPCGLDYPILVRFEKQSIATTSNTLEQTETKRLNKMIHGQAPAHGLVHFQHACFHSKSQHSQLWHSLTSLPTLSLHW